MENEDEQEQMKMGNKEALVLELNEQPPERGKSSSRSTITTQSSIVNDTEEPPKDAKTIEEEKRARRLEIVRKNRNPRDHMYTIRTKNSIVYHGTCLNRIPHGFGRKVRQGVQPYWVALSLTFTLQLGSLTEVAT